MPAGTTTLSDIAIGATCTVREFPPQDRAFVRLREMGLLVGTKVTVVRAAPLGDPLEIKVRGYHLTIRKADAAKVLVDLAS